MQTNSIFSFLARTSQEHVVEVLHEQSLPVEISPVELTEVAGGAPNGTWAPNATW